MIKPIKSLKVFYGGTFAGTIVLRQDNLCSFEYSADWLKNGFSISPIALPLRGGVFTSRYEPFDGLFGVFNDSLPDGWGRLLLDRILRRSGINPASLSPLDRLSIAGKNTMGALTYKPEYPLAMPQEEKALSYLEKEAMKALNEDSSADITLLAEKCGSSCGARPKAMVKVDGEDWLVKFRNSQDPADIGRTEYKYSLIAKKAGLEMPETRLFDGKYFGVKRFDRTNGRKIHVHTAAGLLNADFRLPSLDYETLINATLFITKDMKEAEKMFRLMAFNVIGQNRDDHAKNFSFICDGGKWKLSPAYDLVPSEGINGEHSTSVLGKGKPDEQDMLSLAEKTGINLKTAKNIIIQVKAAFFNYFQRNMPNHSASL